MLEIPDYLSKDAQELLAMLLERDPQKRLGCGPGDAAEIKRQPFFKTVDWEALFYCRLAPPFVPQIVNSMDTSQFDAEFTSMPIVSPSSLKEPPVASSAAAKAFEGFSFVAPHVIPQYQRSQQQALALTQAQHLAQTQAQSAAHAQHAQHAQQEHLAMQQHQAALLYQQQMQQQQQQQQQQLLQQQQQQQQMLLQQQQQQMLLQQQQLQQQQQQQAHFYPQHQHQQPPSDEMS